MSLLLEALKKAEQAKREISAPAPPAKNPPPMQTAGAAPAEPGFPEIALSGPEPPPPQATLRAPPRELPGVPGGKTEPVLSLDLPQPPPPASGSAPGARPPAGENGSVAKTREAAKKFLAAKQAPPRRDIKLLGGLLVAAMAAGAAAYIYRQTSPPPPTPAPAAVAPLPQPPAVQPAEAPAPTPPQPAPVAPEVGGAGGPAPRPQSPVIPGKLAEKPAIPAKSGEALPADAPAGPARIAPPSLQLSRKLEKVGAIREHPFHKDPAPPAAPAPTAARAGSATPDSGIKIRRDGGEPRLDPLLASAYQAFMAGDAARAETDYRKALRQAPNSRDALLGLAAIAANRGQAEQAATHYLRLLQLDPRDAAAHAGLIGLRGDSDPTPNESRLKILLAQHPDAAGALHFVLGNLYAGQARWPEAQEAYFNAFQNDSGNADYVFNLAVSLDHLGQRKPALAYYQRALALAKGRPAGFDSDQLKKRIHEISQD